MMTGVLYPLFSVALNLSNLKFIHFFVVATKNRISSIIYTANPLFVLLLELY